MTAEQAHEGRHPGGSYSVWSAVHTTTESARVHVYYCYACTANIMANLQAEAGWQWPASTIDAARSHRECGEVQWKAVQNLDIQAQTVQTNRNIFDT
eukprot:1195948-Prorocentrum_minimum.AAC.5